MVRDLAHVEDREKARIGVFITLADSTGPMGTEAVKAGYYGTIYGKYPKIQILTIADPFSGKQPNIPLVDSASFKKAAKEIEGENRTIYRFELLMMRALLIRHPWIDKILDGEKTWEIRGSKTSIHGTVALIPSGSGTIIGLCDFVECIGPLSAKMFRKNAAKAGMRPSEATLGRYRNTYAWVLARPKYLKRPVPYKHPSGAVIWVILDGAVERAIWREFPSA
jgi:hypothetical protein